MQKNNNNKHKKNSKINIVSKQNKNPPKPNNKQIIATSKKHLKDKKPNNKTTKKCKGLKKQHTKIIKQTKKNSTILGKIKVTNSLSLHKQVTSLLSKQLLIVNPSALLQIVDTATIAPKSIATQTKQTNVLCLAKHSAMLVFNISILRENVFLPI